MSSDANLMKLIVEETMPLAFRTCKVYSIFSGNRTASCVYPEFLFLAMKCSVSSSKYAPNLLGMTARQAGKFYSLIPHNNLQNGPW